MITMIKIWRTAGFKIIMRMVVFMELVFILLRDFVVLKLRLTVRICAAMKIITMIIVEG